MQAIQFKKPPRGIFPGFIEADCFFSRLAKAPSELNTLPRFPPEVLDGIVWFQDTKERPKENELSIADVSEGWAAFAIDGKLFIKKFTDIKQAQAAPGEAELSIYVSNEADYIEFEIQGQYTTLTPGVKMTWNIEWIAVDIPETIRAAERKQRTRRICTRNYSINLR